MPLQRRRKPAWAAGFRKTDRLAGAINPEVSLATTGKQQAVTTIVSGRSLA